MKKRKKSKRNAPKKSKSAIKGIDRLKKLKFRLWSFSNKKLANIYKATIGYDPFEDGATRKDVINILYETEAEGYGPLKIYK